MGVQLPSEPITRKERYLAKAAGQAVEVPAEPITREEAYLAAIAEGSGGGGTTNYNNLSNQPQINNNTLIGNKSASDLGLVAAETGKGLSENNYTDTDKAKVDASLNVFTGTHAEWEALSAAEKKAYQRADFTDDYDPTAIGDLTALHTSAKSSIVNAINEVKDGLTDYVKIGIAYLAEDVTVQVGFFDLQFPVPVINNYKPIGVTTYNFADRGIASNVHISGIDRSTSVVHIYGSVSQEVTFRTSAYVCVLYIRV